MATVTTEELGKILRKTKGATILSLSWFAADPARYKADRGRITKVSRFSGMVNARYDKKKAKNMGIEVGEVEIAQTAWLDHDGTCVSTHNGGVKGDSPKRGTEYVTFYPQSGETEFSLDSLPCSRDDIKGMIKPTYKGKKGGKQKGAVTNFRRVTLTNVIEAVINGVTYEVKEG